MSQAATGRKVYKNSDMTQAAADSGANLQGTVRSLSGGWFVVDWADGTVTYESVEWHSLYVPTF